MRESAFTPTGLTSTHDRARQKVLRMLKWKLRRWQASVRVRVGVWVPLRSKEIPIRIHHLPIDNLTPTGSCVGLLAAQTGVGADGTKASITYAVLSDDVCLC